MELLFFLVTDRLIKARSDYHEINQNNLDENSKNNALKIGYIYRTLANMTYD